MNIEKMLAQELGVETWQVNAAVALLDEGCTVPFIARYRKEKTGSLNDEVLRTLEERLAYLRGLEERKEQIIAVITEQGKMTDELRAQIEAAVQMVTLEDLYRPYRPKRRTRATIAKEKGLEGLALFIRLQAKGADPEVEAAKYISEDKGVANVQEALAGACDIIAETISDEALLRTWIREKTIKEGTLVTAAKDQEEGSVYEMYSDYAEPVKRVPGHRTLAIDRGEKEKALTVRIEGPQDQILSYMEKRLINGKNDKCAVYLKAAAADSLKRLIAPSIENEIRSMLTEKAQEGAIDVFGKNLKQLLMAPPIAGHTVLGWDPAFRTGCKLAVVDETGKVLDTAVIYPTAPTSPAKQESARKTLKQLIDRYNVTLFSVGNGTASRESETFIADFFKQLGKPLHYVIVNEAGASVYSASALATKEFPNFDVGQRSAASIARRLQDPLAELVKIDPKAIGVGQYQHDMNQKKLDHTLQGVVEDCVNAVGVDLNTASAQLLSFISGISAAVAGNIVAYREANGRFTDRRELKKVPKLGPKAFEQCAGFLRIKDGKNPLDYTGVHPESYEAAGKLLASLGYSAEDLKSGATEGITGRVKNIKKLSEELNIGEPTLKDILKELEKPGRDPRSALPAPVLRSDVLAMEDLKEGMVLKGTVRNVIDFGAFVDIGVHQDGLVHISQITRNRFIKHPMEVLKVGDIVEVKVLSVDIKRKRISLTMLL